jgi:protein-tyrosine phosphatase
LAENMFRRLAKEAGVGDKYEVCSAGTGAWHVGEPPDSRMRRVASRHGLVYDGQARQFRKEDFARHDLILTMDRENFEHLIAMASSAEEKDKIRLLREFDPDGGPRSQVPDPYYGGIDGFEEVYKIVERSARGLLNKLEYSDGKKA